MIPVEIVPTQGRLVLRARGSELLILPHHIQQLKDNPDPKDFVRYFMDNALINRPARKLFEAWLRKDGSLWKRIYQVVKEIEVVEPDERQENQNLESTLELKSEANLDDQHQDQSDKSSDSAEETVLPKKDLKSVMNTEESGDNKSMDAAAEKAKSKKKKSVSKSPSEEKTKVKKTAKKKKAGSETKKTSAGSAVKKAASKKTKKSETSKAAATKKKKTQKAAQSSNKVTTKKKVSKKP